MIELNKIQQKILKPGEYVILDNKIFKILCPDDDCLKKYLDLFFKGDKMIKYLIKSTNEVRVETEVDANTLHKECEQFAHDNGYILTSWTQTYRNKKANGEIVEEWYICKYILQFNDPKEPTTPLNDIHYDMMEV